jgi:hypothetical protein
MVVPERQVVLQVHQYRELVAEEVQLHLLVVHQVLVVLEAEVLVLKETELMVQTVSAEAVEVVNEMVHLQKVAMAETAFV